MSNSVRPHRRQPTRLHHPWDSPSKNTGVGCHFLLQCMKVKSKSEVTQSCPTLHDPMDCSLSGSSIHGMFQARVLEWVAIAFSNHPVYSAFNIIPFSMAYMLFSFAACVKTYFHNEIFLKLTTTLCSKKLCLNKNILLSMTNNNFSVLYFMALYSLKSFTHYVTHMTFR